MKFLILLIIVLLLSSGCTDYEMHQLVTAQEELDKIDLQWDEATEGAKCWTCDDETPMTGIIIGPPGEANE